MITIPAGSRTRADAVRNRAALVATAGVVFRRDGVAASLEGIATEAGVGSATLHRHFQGRRALLRAVFVETVQDLVVEVGRLSSELPADEVLWAWLDVVVRHCAVDAPLAEAVWSGSTPDEMPSWHPLVDAGAAAFEAAREAGRVRGDIGLAELLTLVNAVASSSAGDAETASRLLRFSRQGLG